MKVIHPMVHSRQMMMTALIAFHFACKLVQPPITHHGSYSALLLGEVLFMSDCQRHSHFGSF